MFKIKPQPPALLTAAATTVLALTAANTSRAVPVTGVYIEDPRCDVIPQQTLSHELGEGGFFPINESFKVNAVTPATFTVCVPDDGQANDWIVDITNTSGIAWTNLFFVADDQMFIGNADGTMLDPFGPPGIAPTDAFRIDSVGLNNNLLGESLLNDGIFAPGESWRFNVSNFSHASGAAFPPIFQRPGIFANSETVNAAIPGTASILAIPVPEPSTIGALVVAGCALLMRRRPRRE